MCFFIILHDILQYLLINIIINSLFKIITDELKSFIIVNIIFILILSA